MTISEELMNRSPSEVQEEQEKKLYAKMYRFLVDDPGDFSHKKDIEDWVNGINKNISDLISAINDLTRSVNQGYVVLNNNILLAIAQHDHGVQVVLPAGTGATIPKTGVLTGVIAPPTATFTATPPNDKVKDNKGKELINYNAASNQDGAKQVERVGMGEPKPPFGLDADTLNG